MNAIMNGNRAAPLGTRRTRLVLEAPVETPDALGGAAISWQPIVTLWARIEARGGREKPRGSRLEGSNDIRITLRWRAGVDTRQRLTGEGRVFAIRAAFDPDGRRRDLVCLCEEVAP